MLNRIVIMGRLTKKPELRRTQSGVAVTSFSLAVERDYKDAEGNRETDFIDVVAWRGTAEFAAKYLDKGRMAAVTGLLQGRSWQDKDGNKRRSMEAGRQHLLCRQQAGGDPRTGRGCVGG